MDAFPWERWVCHDHSPPLAVRVSYGMVLMVVISKKTNTNDWKSIFSGDIFPKIIWEAQSGQNRGLGSGFGAGGSIPGVGARFLGMWSIFGWILGSGPIIRFWRGFAIFQLFSI